MSYVKGKQTPYSDQKKWSNDYLTDPEIVKVLGPFDTDPCCPKRMPWRTAKRMIHFDPEKQDGNGLTQEWFGRVFMNPPYRGVLRWAHKFAMRGNGIALLNGRSTETRATQIIMSRSSAILFPKGRLTFYRVNGKPWDAKWFPSLLIGMTTNDGMKLQKLARKIGGTVYWREQ